MTSVRSLCLISHPDVVISARVPVRGWPLSEKGRARMLQGLGQPWIANVTAVYCSNEQKSVDAARILAGHLAMPATQVPELGENDRSSTGYLPAAEFEATAEEFFAHPHYSVRGWERAVDAQSRIVGAVERIAAADRTAGLIALVSHGAVGNPSSLPFVQEADRPEMGPACKWRRQLFHVYPGAGTGPGRMGADRCAPPPD